MLSHFRDVRPAGEGHIARCPAHEDRLASLSIGTGDDGRVLLHCHAGCSTDDVLRAAGLTMADLFPEGGRGARPRLVHSNTRTRGVTLDAYASAKQLPVSFLQGLGLSAVSYLGAPAVRIPYRDEQGQEVAVQFRLSMEGGDRFRWKTGSKPLPYGLWRLNDAKAAGSIVLVEGASDSQTLWHHDLHALGIPGASVWRSEWDAYAEDFNTIYVVLEPDRGGETVYTWITRCRFRDRVKFIRIDGAKDPSDLYLREPKDFRSRWQDAVDHAVPWTTLDQERRTSEAASFSSQEHGDAALFALLDAAKPTRRPQDLPIADLFTEFHLTAESVRDITPDVLSARLRALAAALNGADRLRRALVADELKKTSKVPAAIVTAALATRDDKPDKTTSGTITLTDDEPSPEPVNGSRLLDETAALIRRHVILSRAQADAIALWISAAYEIAALALMPILLITSPTMRSGKTTLLTLLGAIVPRALAASNLTGAGLARAIAAFNPTLLADEADTWLTDQASELRGIMNAGHTRPTAYVLRCAPDTHEPKMIPCFGARAISMIRRPPSTIADRAIAIDLRRKRADEWVTRLRADRLHDEHSPIRRQWRRWADDHLDALRELDPSVPAGLHDRAADNWRPLLAIADMAGGEWPARARTAAVELSGGDESEESASIELLRDVRAIFEARAGNKPLPSAELTAALVAMPDRPWAEWSGGRPMTSVKLAGRLKPFGLRTRKMRDGARTVNAYALADFLDAWSRYLPADSEQPEQPNESGPEPQVFKSEQKPDVPSQENTFSPMFIESVPTVPTSKPDPGAGKVSSTEDTWLDL